MDTKGEKTKILLSNILKSASNENYNAMISFLSTPEGFEDFCFSIKNGNILTLIFLKNYVQKWIDSNSLNFLYNEKFLTFLIQSTIKGDIKQGGLVQLADYFEILSNNYLIPFEIISTLINFKIFILIDAIFKKYVNHPRSNKLFTEINTTIPIFFPVFSQMFFNPSILEEVDCEYEKVLKYATNTLNSQFELIQPKLKSQLEMDQEYILSIFYSLVYQDIHPLFEDNADHFFKIFFILFDQNQQIINQIFDLFVTKYPEIANFQLIILTLSRYDSLNGLVVNTLTKAYSSSKYFPNVILNFLQRNLNIKMSDDWLSNTQNFIKGNDVQRGFTHRLIRILNCNVYSFENETMFFVATILKYKDQDIINKAMDIINTYSTDEDLVFSAFAYLLTIHEFGKCNISYLDTNLKFICMKYLANSLKAKDTFHQSKILKTFNKGIILHSESLESVQFASPLFYLDVNHLFSKTIAILQVNLDEFSADLLFRLVKSNQTFLNENLYALLNNFFVNIHMISSLTLNYLFEIYILLTLKLKKYNLSLIENILNKEIIDIYNICFFYTSILIQETSLKESFVVYILSQNALWNTKELHPGLCCILISAYKKGIIKKDQIEAILPSIDGFNKTFVMNKADLLDISKREVFTAEENYLINNLIDVTWFLEKFLNKKYVRMIIKKMISENVSRKLIQQVFEKNKINVEYEIYPHSISLYFDI